VNSEEKVLRSRRITETLGGGKGKMDLGGEKNGCTRGKRKWKVLISRFKLLKKAGKSNLSGRGMKKRNNGRNGEYRRGSAIGNG